MSLTAYTACLKSHGVTTTKGQAGFGGGFGGAGTSTTGAAPSGTRPSGKQPTGTRPSGSSTTGGFPGGASGGPAGLTAGNAKFAKAAKACSSKLPKGARGAFGTGGGFRGGAGSAAGGRAAFSTKELDAYVACIRKNGYAAMPDPSTTGGAVFPKSVATNAKFKAANAKCESLLVPTKVTGTQTISGTSSA